MQVGDIDFAQRRLTVSRQLQRVGSTFVARPAKYGSERVVHLPEDPPWNAWLFTVRDGPMYDNDVDWRWRATRTSAGLPHVRLHGKRPPPPSSAKNFAPA